MEIRPIVSSLAKSPVAALLIACQIALSVAILSNALAIIGQRMEMIGTKSGLDEENTFLMRPQVFATNANHRQIIEDDMRLIRGLPGVVAATPSAFIPLSSSGWNSTMRTTEEPNEAPDNKNAAIYFGDSQALNTYQIKLLSGRNFTAEEIEYLDERGNPDPTVVIITKSLAERLYPGESALGKRLDINGSEGPLKQQVIGVVEDIASPWPRSRQPKQVVMITVVSLQFQTYLVRTEPGLRDGLMKRAEADLLAAYDGRLIEHVQAFASVRTDAFRSEFAMAIILAVISLLLLIITGFGIVGQTSFWVVQRTKQIGTRRALGARKADILRYFQMENALITGVGALLGVLLAFALNYLLARLLAAEPLPFAFVPVAVLSLVALGQIAVYFPARRASLVPPAIATRTA